MNKKNIQLLDDFVNMITKIKPRFYLNLAILIVFVVAVYFLIGKEVSCIGVCFK